MNGVLKIFGKLPSGEEWTRIKSSPNFNGRTFENPIPTKLSMNPFRVMREYAKSDPLRRKPPHPVPVMSMTSGQLNAAPADALTVTWLGHASMMVEISGIRILCDPVFSLRVSPFGFAGPKRHHPSPLNKEDLPHIDVILISHNHYDHLDHELIEYLKDRDIEFITPLAVGACLRYWGVSEKNIHELDWHESCEIKGVKMTATPARHFTNRGLFDRNRSFWASFVIYNGQEKAFFCGDSGFFPGFKDIGEQYGPFDVTMIGIGAYNKDWQAIHTNPEEAVEAHQLLRGKYLLPIHWCTFDLALHDWSEPVERLVATATTEGVQLIVPKPGEAVTVRDGHMNVDWWKLNDQ